MGTGHHGQRRALMVGLIAMTVESELAAVLDDCRSPIDAGFVAAGALETF